MEKLEKLKKRIAQILERKKSKEKELELELGKGLQEIGLQISLGFSLEHCFSRIAKKEGILGNEFRIIQEDMEKHGKGLTQAIMNAVHRHSSKSIKQAFLQLIFVYEHGNQAEQEAESLEKIGSEIMKVKIMELREYHSKISVYSIFFVTLSAIVPALFLGFAIIGSAFLDLGLTSLEIWMITGFIFPFLNFCLLLGIQEKTPNLVRTRR
ncbi:MAG: hypothetical protein Q7S92_05725 [Candidatus Diapherotrites archaeon]|nr:hypothetical protein [Candidatus Diapherotrites archaeon]